MIRSEEELTVEFSKMLLISLNNEQIRLGFGVPEEEVIQKRTLPYMSLHFLWDDLYEPNRLMGHYYRVTGEKETLRFAKHEMPEPVMFVYQLDIYSNSSQNLLRLSTELSKAVKRRGSFFYDSDESAVDIFRTDTQDFSQDAYRLGKTEERLFRRSYTYSLACLYDPVNIPTKTYGPVLATDISLHDIRELEKQGEV